MLPTIDRTITQEIIENYAAASGDFNPIHVDKEFAADSQFGGTIAHGMMVAAMISEAMMLAFDTEWIKGGRLKLRFKAPSFPGDTVATFGHIKNIEVSEQTQEIRCAVGVKRQDGQIVITGEAAVNSHSPG